MHPVYYPIEDYAQDQLREAREHAARERLINQIRNQSRTGRRTKPIAWLTELWHKITEQQPLPQGR